MPIEAALEPAMRALGRPGGVVVVGAERRALVEGEGDVGAEPGLYLHRALRREEVLAAVDVGAEANPVLADVEDAAVERRPPPPALDLVGDAPEGERKDLETTGIGDDRPFPAHERVKAAERRDPLASRRQHQVVGVAEDHLVADLRDLVRKQTLDRPAGRERNEARRLDLPVRGPEHAGSGTVVGGDDLEGQAVRVGSHVLNLLR